jgi:hypothetical protein
MKPIAQLSKIRQNQGIRMGVYFLEGQECADHFFAMRPFYDYWKILDSNQESGTNN